MRRYIKKFEYRGFTLAEWSHQIPETNPPVTVERWDVIDSSGQIVTTVTDQSHAESYVDHPKRDDLGRN